MIKRRKKFQIEAFRAPDVEFAPVYSWEWNGACSREETEKQIAEMQRLGIRAFYILPMPKTFRPADGPSFLEPEYLTEPYFEEYAFAVRKAREAGMQCWLYDEGGWPSGGACGRVLLENPSLARRSLGVRLRTVRAGKSYRMGKGTAAAFADGRQIVDGERFAEDTRVEEYFSRRHFFQAAGYADFPDLLLPESTARFLESTHEKYLPYLEESFGEQIRVVFTDEPHACAPAFTAELAERFEETYGESIAEALPALAGRAQPDEKTADLMVKWYDMCSRLFCENYFLPLKKWSNAHKMAFSGHLGGDDDPDFWKKGGYLHIMRDLRCMDVPGVDVIWRQIYPGKPYTEGVMKCAVNGFFPRYASSAAAQVGTFNAVSESFAIYGDGLTYDLMRYVVGFQAVRGINRFNVMNLSYQRWGFNTTLGSFEEIKACHKDLALFNRYVERISYLYSVGERVCDSALYLPIRDMWAGRDAGAAFDRMGRALEDARVDFDIVDDDVFERANGVEKGEIRMGGACYRHVFIPADAHMTEKSRRALAIFEKNGGKVYRSAQDAPEVSLPVGACAGLRLTERVAENARLIFCFNENERAVRFSLASGAARVYLLDPAEGRLFRAAPDESVLLGRGETIVVIETAEDLPAETRVRPSKEFLLSATWEFRKVNAFVLGELREEYRTFEEPYSRIALGDWSKKTGKAFSGTCEYRTEFSLPAQTSGAVVLDLGEVRYVCEAFLNGKPLGKRIMPPYRYEIGAEDLRAQNELLLRVTNTPANQYYYTRTYRKWAKWQMGPYFARQKIFNKDSLSGGLYGPVVIRY